MARRREKGSLSLYRISSPHLKLCRFSSDLCFRADLAVMDKISGLPDELLVKIITLVPTKVAVSTSILSKRWKFLWMFCTKLKYTDKDIPHRPKPRLWEFVDKNLPLHRAPVIESFHLHYSSYSGAGKPEDIKRWIEIAVSRCVRELVIYHRSYGINILPNKFYTCKSLVYLKLSHVALIDVPSTGCCSLPSLKTLKLKYVSYANEDSLQQLLSACPVLEELLLHFEEDDTMTDFTVIVPSLKSLSIFIPICCPGLVGYVIDTPSLEYFKIEDQGELWHNAEIKNMPKLKEACICEVPDLESFIESITSVKRLTICPEQDRYGDGFVFSQLEHLQLCACRMNPLNLLSQLLNDSPNLRVLDISVIKEHEENELYDYSDGKSWKQPSHVPECLLSTLQIFNWSRYFGRPNDRDTAVYILKNGRHLKTATILADSRQEDVSDFTMITELAHSSRASSLCELVFVGK